MILHAGALDTGTSVIGFLTGSSGADRERGAV
jgi:hypothetical protein